MTLVTVASGNLTVFLSSNSAANAWCARAGDGDKRRIIPAMALVPTVNMARIKLTSRSLFRWGRIARHVAFVDGLARGNLARDVAVHGGALPMFDQLLLTKVPIHGVCDHLVTPEVGPLGVRLQQAISGHADLQS